MSRCSPARTTNILAAAAVRSVCVLSSVCVAVFDCDELTCIQLLQLCRKFCHVLLVVWVDPNLFPGGGLGLQRNASFNNGVDLGKVCIVFPIV